MNITELIRELEKIKNVHGDLQIETSNCDDVIMGVTVRKGYPGIEPPVIGVIQVKDCWG